MRVSQDSSAPRSPTFSLLGAGVAGIGLAIAQTCPSLWFLTLLAPIPLLATISFEGWCATWLSLAIVSGLQALFALEWLRRTAPGYGWILAIAAVVSALSFLPPSLVFPIVARRLGRTAALTLVPVVWAGVEYVGSRHLFGAWWPFLGQPLAEQPWLCRSAAVLGPEGITYFALALGVFVSISLRRDRNGGALARAAALGPGLAIATSLLGSVDSGQESQPSKTARIALVQPGLEHVESWTEAERSRFLERMDHLVDSCTNPPVDLVVLPESAVPEFVKYDDVSSAWVKALVQRSGTPLLFGSLDRNADGSRSYNVAILIIPNGEVLTYRKVHLAPVSERIHFPTILGSVLGGTLSPLLVAARGGREEFTAGTGVVPFHLPSGMSFGPLICIEDAYPDLAREYASRGADHLIALVNTQRYDGTSLARQHLQRARLTCIATGLPMVRCTNSGISCVISPHGEVLGKLPESADAGNPVVTAHAFVAASENCKTLYRRFGSWPLLMTLLGVVAIAVIWRT